MFREMRRINQKLSVEECDELLFKEKRGVLSVCGDEGYPYGIPVNYVYSEGKLYFHCAKEGHKLDSVRKCSKVSFCVYDEGFKKDGDWAYYVKSVIVFGNIREVTKECEKNSALRKLGNKYYPDNKSVEIVLQKHSSKTNVLEISPEFITGKLVHEK